jgi:DNA-binding HxlR family transcriptional regulator
MLDNVEAELKQIDNMQQVELTYNEARVLKALLRFSPQDTNHLHGFIGRISRTRLLQTCRRLEELGLAGKTIVSPGGLASWYITDVGRGHRQLDELATGRA